MQVGFGKYPQVQVFSTLVCRGRFPLNSGSDGANLQKCNSFEIPAHPNDIKGRDLFPRTRGGGQMNDPMGSYVGLRSGSHWGRGVMHGPLAITRRRAGGKTMITLNAVITVSSEATGSPVLGAASSPEDWRAQDTTKRRRPAGRSRRAEMTNNGRAAAPTVRPRPTEEHDESQPGEPSPAEGGKDDEGCRTTAKLGGRRTARAGK